MAWGVNLIPAWIYDCIHYQVWDEITYPLPNFSGAVVEVCEWKSDFTWHFLPEASLGLQVMSLPASVCVCVFIRLSGHLPSFQHNNLWPIEARIIKFGTKVQNTLIKIPVILGVIDPDLQGQI